MASLLDSTREFPRRDVHLYSVLCPNVISLLLSTKKCSSLLWIQGKVAICCAPLMEFPSRGILGFSALLHKRFPIRDVPCFFAQLYKADTTQGFCSGQEKVLYPKLAQGIYFGGMNEGEQLPLVEEKMSEANSIRSGLLQGLFRAEFFQGKNKLRDRLDFILWLIGFVFRAWLVSLHRVCMFSSSGVQCGFLALILGPICVSFTGSSFENRVCFFRWTFYPTQSFIN